MTSDAHNTDRLPSGHGRAGRYLAFYWFKTEYAVAVDDGDDGPAGDGCLKADNSLNWTTYFLSKLGDQVDTPVPGAEGRCRSPKRGDNADWRHRWAGGTLCREGE